MMGSSYGFTVSVPLSTWRAPGTVHMLGTCYVMSSMQMVVPRLQMLPLAPWPISPRAQLPLLPVCADNSGV